MAEIKVLVEGYAREEGGVELASSTTTLIREGDLKIIVDPGMNKKLLLEALEKENLTTNDIDYVFLSHNHMDHILLAGIFENAKILDEDAIYSFNGTIKSHESKIPGTSIEIVKTPGHDQLHSTIFVDTKEFGKVAIAADVFWWADNEEQKTDKESLINREDPYVKDKEKLVESRKKLLEIADYIIPGHGKMFKVEK